MKKGLALLICVIMCAAMLAGCAGEQTPATTPPVEDNTPVESPAETNDATTPEPPVESSGDTYAPVTIDNFNSTTTYDAIPERVIVLSYNAAEIMAALGVADRIVGIQRGQNSIDDVLPEYKAALTNAPVPEELNAGGVPTIETMLTFEPDLVVLNSYYFNVATFGTREDYAINGTNMYITEGSYVPGCTIENTYNDIRNMGKIFGVEDKAEDVIADMKASVASVTDKLANVDPIRVMSFDAVNNDLAGIAGGKGLAHNLIELAGGENIFADVEMQFSQVSWEEVINRDPDVIIIHKYAPADDAEVKIEYLKNKPELSDVSAIKNDRFIVVTLFSIFPGMQNPNAIETIARGLHTEAFN